MWNTEEGEENAKETYQRETEGQAREVHPDCLRTPNTNGLLGCLGLVVIDLKGDQPAQFCVLFSNSGAGSGQEEGCI